MPTNENLPVVAVDNADHRCHAETTVGHLKGYSYWFHAQLASDIYIYMPYGYLTQPWKRVHLQMVYLLKMVLFYGYVT